LNALCEKDEKKNATPSPMCFLKKIEDKLDFDVGMSIEADFEGKGRYYPGKVVKVHSDGACDIDYSDGDKESRVPCSRVRVLGALKKVGEDLGL
jgi:hypothetical protein